ncbi:MAG: methyltransferase family protein [Acidobacteriota bacterium]
MFVFIRAITYALVFVSVVLVFLPARVLFWSGVTQPAAMGWPQIAGIAVCALGAAVALWCVLCFVWIGKGTPAPFDPSRRLVVCGPYDYVRNPMYIGAAVAVAGAALYFESVALLVFVAAFLGMAHLFVTLYEEPTLRRMFGADYESYYRRVHRWLPGRAAAAHPHPVNR